MNSSDEITNEVARLMRDPDALRHERERMPSSGRGHYDSSQPRVPAGQSGGGQWADTGRSAVKLAQAQEQSPLSLKELVRICALEPGEDCRRLCQPLYAGGRESDPLTGKVRTLDWVRQEAQKMEENIRKIQQQLCRPA